MKLSQILLPVAVATAVVTLPAVVGAEPSVFEIDPVHSSVIWKARHMNTSNVYGRFNDVTGKITVDDKDPSKNALDVVVKAESFDSGNEKRDQHVKGPDFLNAKQFPEITLKSDKVTKIDNDSYSVEGKLTLHGVTKPVSFKFKRVGTGKHPRSGKELAGGEAEFTIKRSDFGVNYMPQGLGDEISIIASVEAAKQ